VKKTEFGGKLTRIPSPYDATSRKTERSAVAVLMHWMREIIEQKNLDLGLPDVDTSGADRKSPDIIICESRRSQNVLCVIEAKHPHFNVFDYEDLRKPAWEKANARKAKYFATTNFKELIWFNTQKVNEQRNEEEQVVHKYHLSEIENLDLIEEARYKEGITKQLESFLNKLYAVHTRKEHEPKLPTDEFLIYRLHSKIKRLSRYYPTIIDNRCHKDNTFARELGKWFNSQGWNFAWQPQDFDKAARQAAYLLVNKILFYNVLQAKRPSELPLLKIPEGLLKGAQLQKILQSFFDEVLKVDYQTIYTADFIDAIAFLDEKEVIKEINDLVNVLGQYDFSKLGDIIGPIFERLIPQDERHNLGQYFTNPDVVDIILEFCLRHEDDKILDPACGAGTFLVRAYHRKKLGNQRLSHERILDTLWGNDIAKFPAHLSTINLAIRDLSVDKNYPNILQEDFFNLLSTEGGFELSPKSMRAIAKRLDMKEKEIPYPRWFDCVVGNPPYTRQEEMPEIAPDVKQYKEGIIDKALKDNTGKKIAEISKRAGIHAYFFVHGMKFLRDGGRFGFIVSNSWLDVDYGKGLQEFFLNNYKITAIIESKVERWFEWADVNTCIVILEKCKDKKERDENLVRFVYLFQPLTYFIPPVQEMWQEQVERLKEIDKLIKTIMAHSEFYQNEDLRIFPKSQKELWEEGFDKESGKYVGAKWGKYLRAPEIFFKILEKGKGKLVPLKEVADVGPGCYSGINDFFYLDTSTVKRWRVEKGFLKPIIRTSNQVQKLFIDTGHLDSKVFSCGRSKEDMKSGGIRGALSYIQWGEQQKTRRRQKVAAGIPWPEVETVKRRTPGWWAIPESNLQETQLFMLYVVNDRFLCAFSSSPIISDRCFHRIFPSDIGNSTTLWAVLNSTLMVLMIELYGRHGLGQGALKFETMDTKQLPIVDPRPLSEDVEEDLANAIKRIASREIDNIFNEVNLQDRRELDKIVMGEILGLTDEEQLEVYRAVVDLVKSRIERAKSFGKRRKTKEGIDIDLLVKTVMDKLGDNTLGKFYREKVLAHKPLRTKSLPKVPGEVKLEQELFGWRLSSGRERVDCASEMEARYLKVWLEAGLDSIKIPKEEGYLKEIVPKLESLKKKTDEVFEDYLGSILDPRLRQRLIHQLWQEATR